MKILVTGGAGFIGSAMCRYLINQTDNHVVNLDALTYAGDLSTVDNITDNSRYKFEKADIRDANVLQRIFKEHSPDAVMNFAAESHVDRSIDGPGVFIQTNIVGTYNLLQESRKHWLGLPEGKKKAFRFHHISTDEVYGSLGRTGFFTEQTAYEPNSPYSASKASADHLVRAWHETFGLPTIISNCSNNYGPYQFPEKFIPVMILNALEGNSLPVYGKGKNIRDWLHVEDHVMALYMVLTKGRPGDKYNVGGAAERQNIEVAEMICEIMDELLPNALAAPHRSLITFVEDRPGHDLRYAVDFSKIRNELGWQPKITFEVGLKNTVQWYIENQDWWQNVAKRTHQKRLGNAV